MTAPDPLAPKIEQAVDALLRAIVEAEGPQPGAAGARLSLIAINIEKGAVTAENLDEIIANPVGLGCRSEMAALGSLLFDTVGTPDTVADVVKRIAGDGDDSVGRVAILDEVWQQVGTEGDADWR